MTFKAAQSVAEFSVFFPPAEPPPWILVSLAHPRMAVQGREGSRVSQLGDGRVWQRGRLPAGLRATLWISGAGQGGLHSPLELTTLFPQLEMELKVLRSQSGPAEQSVLLSREEVSELRYVPTPPAPRPSPPLGTRSSSIPPCALSFLSAQKLVPCLGPLLSALSQAGVDSEPWCPQARERAECPCHRAFWWACPCCHPSACVLSGSRGLHSVRPTPDENSSQSSSPPDMLPPGSCALFACLWSGVTVLRASPACRLVRRRGVATVALSQGPFCSSPGYRPAPALLGSQVVTGKWLMGKWTASPQNLWVQGKE